MDSKLTNIIHIPCLYARFLDIDTNYEYQKKMLGIGIYESGATEVLDIDDDGLVVPVKVFSDYNSVFIKEDNEK